MSHVWVEIGDSGLPVRIFKNEKIAFKSGILAIASMDRTTAVSLIRHTIFVRSDNHCELCDSPIIEVTMQMHEMRHRGKGGEISLANSVAACARCHKYKHRERNPQWSK